MGGAFVTIFIIIIVLNALSAAGEKKLKKGTKTYRAKTGTGGSRSPWGDTSGETSAQRSSEQRQNVSFKKGMQQAAARESQRRMKNLLEDRREEMASRRKDPADQNRRRMSGWGERERRGILSVSNVLLAATAIIVLLYIFQ